MDSSEPRPEVPSLQTTPIEEAHSKLFSPIVAASLSGFISRLLLHPSDTVKTRILNQKQYEHDRYRSFSDASRRILREEGILAFYRGLAPSLLLAAPAQAVYLSSYDYSKTYIGNFFPSGYEHSFPVHFLSGLSAEALSCIFWVPHDMIKERMQVDKLPRLSSSGDLSLKSSVIAQQRHMQGHFLSTVNTIWKEGVRNVYKGYGITLFSYAPLSGFYFLGYEKLKEMARSYRNLEQDADLPLYPDILLCSMLGISFAAILTQPFDLVKTRYQIQKRAAMAAHSEQATDLHGSHDGKHYYRNSMDGFRKIIRHEGGVRTLWKGTGARLLYTAPNAALIMILYEYFKQL